MSSQTDTSPLSNIMYISLPEQMHRSIGDFTIDPRILIPVEVLPGSEPWDVNDLSWEMIIAAMIKILVYDRKNAHKDYYRRFVLAARPGIVEEMSSTAIQKAEEKSFEIAEELFKAVASLTPQDVTNLLNLSLVFEEHARVYEQRGKADLAERYVEFAHTNYKECLAIAPDDQHVLFNAGHFYLKQRNYTRARSLFERYLALVGEKGDKRKKAAVKEILDKISDQAEVDQLFSEAFDFIRLGKEQEGIDRINSFLEVYPDVWNAWFVLGWGLRRLERYGEGKVAFLRALELGPEQPDTLNELAICLMELNEYEDCRKVLERALSMEPENVKIISNLGILSLKQNKLDEARAYFRSVLEIEPDDPIARNYIVHLDAGSE